MELLEVRGRPHRVFQYLAAQLRAAREELSNERPVEHLFEDVRERLFGSARLADLLGQRLESVEGERIDVRDERHAEQDERLVEVLEVVMREQRCAAEQRPPRPASVAGSLAPLFERSGERPAERVASGLLVALASRVLEDVDRIVRGRSAQREIEEAAGTIGLPARCRDLGGARERVDPVGGALGAGDLSLVQVDDIGGLVGERSQPLQELFGFSGRDARQPGLAVLDRLQGRSAGRHADLCLSDELARSFHPGEVARHQIVSRRQPVEILRS